METLIKGSVFFFIVFFIDITWNSEKAVLDIPRYIVRIVKAKNDGTVKII